MKGVFLGQRRSLPLEPKARDASSSSRGAPRLSFPAWCKYLAELAAAKKMEVNIIKIKLINCGPPGVTDGTVTPDLNCRKLKTKCFLLENRQMCSNGETH